MRGNDRQHPSASEMLTGGVPDDFHRVLGHGIEAVDALHELLAGDFRTVAKFFLGFQL